MRTQNCAVKEENGLKNDKCDTANIVLNESNFKATMSHLSWLITVLLFLIRGSWSCVCLICLLCTEVVEWFIVAECFQKMGLSSDIQLRLLHVFGAVMCGSQVRFT